MKEDSIIEKTSYKVTPQVNQECVVEFDQNYIGVFSSIVVYNDSKSNESVLVKVEFDHSSLVSKEWTITNDKFAELSSVKLDALSVELGDGAFTITQRTETKLRITAKIG